MCNESKVMAIVKLGKKEEIENPQKAAKLYLEAASQLLKLSKKNTTREGEYIDLANKIYLKAKTLKKIKTSKSKPSKVKEKFGFNSIGGLQELKEEIRFKIIEPLSNPDLFKFYGKSVGGGIIMYGPPGCGKTLIAKATSNEAKTTFIHVKSSDLKSKFVGETEQNIAELFEEAREKQPSIIFFDEFEALGGDRSDGLAHERSAVAQLLTEMDGMDSGGQQILLLAATNEPWAIDPALRREGRFGTTIFIPPPDVKSREQIFKIEMEKRPTKILDYKTLAKKTEGFSGADLKAICEHATNIALKESLETGEKRKITMQDLQKSIKNTQSVMKQWFSKAQDQIEKRNLQESFNELIIKARELNPHLVVA